MDEVIPKTKYEVTILLLSISSCTSREDCKETKTRRITALAFVNHDGTGCSESKICCHEANIIRPCSDYSEDGYNCSKTCFDLPQDQLPPNKRKSKIHYYDPKLTKCPEMETCCKRREPLPQQESNNYNKNESKGRYLWSHQLLGSFFGPIKKRNFSKKNF